MAAAHDHMAHFAQDWSTPAMRATPVTPSDSTDLTDVANRLYIGGGAPGDVHVVTRGGDTVLFKKVPVGSILPVRVKRVLAAGTTATDIVALW